MTNATDWPSIRLRYMRGETPYAIAKSLGNNPCRQWIGKRAKAEGWDQGIPGIVAKTHLDPPKNSPSKDSPERRERVIQILTDGGSYKLAAAAIGVSQTTLKRWRDSDTDFENLCRAAMAEFIFPQLKKVRESKDTRDTRFLLQHHPLTREDYQEQRGVSGLTLNFGIIRDARLLEKNVTPEPILIEAQTSA